MKKIISWISRNELAVMISVLVLLAITTVCLTLLYDYVPIMIHKSIYRDASFWESFLVNLHNSVFDFLFLGILLYYFTNRINEKRKIEEYHNNIEDVRFWFREEATSKIVANITRLNQNNCTKINLSKCFLKDAYLRDVKLINSQLMGTVLEGSVLKCALLDGSDFKGAKLENANLTGASLNEAKMRYIFCSNTNFTGANLTNTDLRQARLINSNFKSAILKGADLNKAEFDNSSFIKTNFIGAKNIDINSIIKARTLKGSKFDDQVKVEINRIKPELFTSL